MPQLAQASAPAIGRYQILSELGRGAMGVVYRAIDPLLERSVAIKAVNLADALDEAAEYATRFQQEAKAVGRLAHPNIITIYDAGRDGDIAFMAMELLDGCELRSLIGRHGRLPVLEAIRIAAQVADGLAYAHERGVIHRDVKPGNIMILDSGVAKIMDFGIARMRSSDVRTKTGILLGSPKYMSPEQVLGRPIDGRSDIFSLGIVLHEMLTGSAPFAGDTVSNLMYQIATAPVTPPSHANAAVPQMLDFIVAKALAKEVEERYQSASELAADLRQCTEDVARIPLSTSAERTVAQARTVLLDQEIESTRVLTSRVDSMPSATRVAAATAIHSSLDTILESSPEKETPLLSSTPVAPDAHLLTQPGVPSSAWTWQERLVLGVGLTVGVIIAAFIALT